jgi:CTP:molybdopterin cytidylyltransferase MocA
MRIQGLILAAGAGRRLGGPKALLSLRGRTFLAHAVELLSRPDVAGVTAVVGYDAARVGAEAVRCGADLVVNEEPSSGMLGSVLCGLAHAEHLGSQAVLVHLVDHPLVSATTVDHVIAALRADAPIAVPTWQGRRGHPAGFGRAAWTALRGASPDEGARAVLRSHPEWISHVAGDPGCIKGINTLADYEELRR